MIKTLSLPTLRLSLVTAALLSLTSCEVMSGLGLTSGPLGEALKSVQSLTGNITNWSSKLGTGAISDAAINQLGGFANQAGGLTDTLKQALGGTEASLQKKVEPVTSGLSKLANFKTEDLLKLAAPERQAQVQQFSSTATDLGGIVKGLLGS